MKIIITEGQIKNLISETIKDGYVLCDNCKWKWSLKDGGGDKYKCHKCGHNNDPKNERFLKCRECNKKFTQTIHKGKKSLPICTHCGVHNNQYK